RTRQNPSHSCACGTEAEEGGAKINAGLFLCLAGGRARIAGPHIAAKHKIQPKSHSLPLADTKEMNRIGCISSRTNERLHRYEQLPPAGQAAQPEGQGAAVADAFVAGRLG